MDIPAGRAIGPYDVISPLGRGGMGAVYLARDRRLGRQVALKFLHADGVRDDGRLLREARAASTLNHPNICQIFDIGGDGAAAWIAMEYVDGQPLAASIPPTGMRPDAAVRIVSQLARALAHAHARGIIHRDLKPANIVCDAAGQPKILDFGISSRSPEKIASDLTQTETSSVSPALEGSLPFMAPEVLRGAIPDQRADLWSLGVVFYELLTGRQPFRGSSLEVISAILDGRIPPLPAHVPPPVARIAMRLLANAAAERYASASEVVAALDTLSETAPSRRRLPRAAIAAVALLAIGIGGYLAWSNLRSRPLRLVEQLLVSVTDIAHRAPSFSPDATSMAVIVPDAAGVPQVRVVNLAQKTFIQITSGSAAAARPRWSPKGDQIVYGVDGQGIWSVSPVGGTPRRIIENGFNPNLSRDGARLVFERRDGLYTANVDGSQPAKIAGSLPLSYGVARGPAFSPDGSEIAFFQAAAGPNGDLWTLPSRGGTPRRLTSDLREGGWPVWTQDGAAIIYSSARRGSRTLWQIPAGGGEPVPLTVGAGEDDEPELSEDGRQIAYSNVRNTWDLRTRDLSTGTERSLLRRGTEMVFPQFSPDGKRIVFFGRADYAVAVFTINADGSGLRQLTDGRELNHQPRWSHDGEHVYFYQIQPELSFRRIPSVGGASTAVRPWDYTTSQAALMDPTGRYFAYLRTHPPGGPSKVPEHTVIHTIATGEEREWPEPHTHVGGWSSDGHSIVGFQHPDSVVVCTVENAQCRAVTKGAMPVWPPDSGRLFFARPVSSPGAPQELWSVALDGSDERLETPMGTFRSIDRFFTVSRDRVAAWGNFIAGRPEVWTASVK